MDYACITITKRDGSKENFSIEKIERAIAKAYRADGMNDDETSIKQVTAEVAAAIDRENISVEEIQDLVERKLMMRNPSVAKKFIIYRFAGITAAGLSGILTRFPFYRLCLTATTEPKCECKGT